MVKISVIIPVYNVEKYLKKCLDSVIGQTFSDIEIICVNDGSTDASLSILEDYAKSDNRFKVYSKNNGGQGSARNLGLKNSSGDYVYFIDADDYIEENMFEKLYRNAISNNSDIVVSKIARFNDESDEINYNNPGFNFENQFKNVDFDNFSFTYSDIKKYVLNSSFAPWMKLFKKEFLSKNNFQFVENLFYEDVLFHVQTFLKAERISFSPNFFYYYRNNPTSTMNTSENGYDIFGIIDLVEKFLKENDFFQEFKDEFYYFKVTQIMNYLLSTDSQEYFEKSKDQFLKIDLSTNKLIPDNLRKKFNLVLRSDSLNDYKNYLNSVGISVVIPVYNVEDYLEECLDSVVNQTFKNIEIICVNDGSTDNSLNILNKYSKKDSRIKIINQENSGVSHARNKGLEVSRGNYVCFLDSDDYLELNALQEVHNISEINSLDICLFKLINFDEKTHKQFTEEYFDMSFLKKKYGTEVFNHEKIGKDIFWISVTPHSKLFRRNVISQLKFPEGLIYEDNVFFTQAMLKAKRVLLYDKYLYNRRIRLNSITHSYDEKCIDWIEIYNLLIDMTNDSGFYEEYKSVMFEKAIFSSYNIFKELSEEFKQNFFLKLKKDYENKQSEWLSDDRFNNSNDRLKFIFKECLNSHNHVEFELKVDLFDLKKLNSIDKIDISVADDNFDIEDKKLFMRYINSYKKSYVQFVGTPLVKYSLTPMIDLIGRLALSKLPIQDKIDILRYAKPLFYRLIRINGLQYGEKFHKFMELIMDNKFVEALKLFGCGECFELSDVHNEIFLLFWGLHEKIGGLTKAVCDRANLFNKNGYSVRLLNIDSLTNSEFIINKYYRLGFLDDSIEIINIFDYYSKKNTIDSNCPPADLNLENGSCIVKKSSDSESLLTLKYFDCSSEDECSPQNLIEEEMYISGYLALKKLFNDGKLVKEYYYTVDDYIYFYIDHENNDILLFDRKEDSYVSFKNIEEFQDYFVSELCLTSKNKPFLVNDCSSRYPSIKNIESDIAFKIGIVHNNPYFEPYGYGSRRWNIASLNDIEYEDVVVVLAETAKRDFIKEFNLDKFRVIPNFATEENIEKSSKRYPKDNNVISIFARISSDKNISDLIEAFNLLLKKHSNAILKIYGRALIPEEIKEKEKLENLVNELGINDSVKFMGHVDNVYEEMSKSLVTVLCSNIEGFGLVIIESMINLTPVISYDTNYGPSDIIVDGENGFIVNRFDIEALSERLVYAFENPEKIHEMGILARNHVLNNFTEEIILNKWEKLFKDLISNNNLT